MSEPGQKPLAPPPAPADVGVVMAMPMEAGHLIDRLSRVRKYTARSLTVVEGELEGRVLAVLASGVGVASARKGVNHLLDGHRPGLILSAGFAGAVDPVLNRNDLAAPRMLVDGSGAELPLDPSLAAATPGVKVVDRLLLVDHVVTAVREKALLRERHRADLIDMESFAAAETAFARHARFLSLRVVSDDARTELPAEIGRLLNTSGSYRVGAALRALWGRPSTVKDFWTLHAHAMESADRLADGIQVVLRGLS